LRTVVAIWRILRVIGMVAQGLWLIAFAMPRTDAAGWHAIMQRWAVKLLRCLGVTVRVSGEPQPGAVLMVANHVSWLDIPALHASSPRTRFVSKSVIAHWPLLGRLARAGGTLFIERERKRDALRVVHEVAAALKNHDAVAVFPEGTTGAGHEVLPFHANLLQAAITTGTLIQPIVLLSALYRSGSSSATCINLNGRRQTYAPNSTFNIGAEYRFRFGDKDKIIPRLNFGHVGNQWATLFENASLGDRLGDRNILNAQLAWQHGSYTITGYATNLTDQHYAGALNSGLYFAGPPRQYGVKLLKIF